jgi:hypothetical protein
MQMFVSRRFPPPWSAKNKTPATFVRDHDGQQLAYVYFEDEPGRRVSRLIVLPRVAVDLYSRCSNSQMID